MTPVVGVVLACLWASPSDRGSLEAELFSTPTMTATSSDDGAAFSDWADEPTGALSRMTRTLERTDDVLQIGAQLFVRLDTSVLASGPSAEFPLSSANLLDVYLDAKLGDRLRAFARGRLVYDPTFSADGPVGFSGREQALEAELDQLWLKFDIGRVVFVTFGRQPIKWGTGRFWNPTDFVNQQVRDPLAFFDERLGVTLLKLHFPIEALGWNIYALMTLDGVDSPEDIGGALRLETTFGPAEFAISAFLQKDAPVRLAADFSAAVWQFDLRGEIAVLHGIDEPRYASIGGGDPFDSRLTIEQDDWLVQVMVGAEIAIRYSDQDSLILGAEYFYNQLGYSDPGLYTFLAVQGQFRPLYVGEHYAGLYLLVAAPGSWNDTTFIVTALSNLSDRTVLTRFDYRVRLLTYLDLNAYVAGHFGGQGEFRFEFEIPPGAIPGVDAFRSAAPAVDLGLGARLSF